jgi:hypothetical protein
MENLQPTSEINETALRPDPHQRFLHALMRRGTISVVLSLLVAAVWLPFLRRSFWVDEANTFWAAHEGPIRAVQKTLQMPGQSLLYSAIASLFCFDGSPFRDILLRLPSLIGIAVAAWFLYRIAEGHIARGAGVVAITLFLLHPDVVAIGTQARSYALAMGAVVASCWALCEWVETRSRIYLLWYVLASTMVIYLHYFFAVIFGVQVLYLLFILLVDRRPNRWLEILCAGVVVIILSLPLIPHLKLLVSESHTLPFVGAPPLKDLTDYLVPSVLVLGLLVVGYLLPVFYPNLVRQDMNLKPAFLFLIAAWWLLGPMLFFAVSKLSPMRVFVPRYLAFTLAAQSLLFAYIGIRLFGSAGARVWALAAVLLVAANALFVGFHRYAARELLPLIHVVRSEPNAPVFFPSLLVESQFYDWRAGNQPSSYLFSPLVAYPIPNRLIPLPYAPTGDIKGYISDAIDTQLNGTSEVLFVAAGDSWESFARDWVTDRMRLAGFHATVRRGGSFTVLVFTK